MIIFLLHLFAMALVYFYLLAKKTDWPTETKFLGGLVISWSSIIYTSALLACFNWLGNNPAFLASSLMVQALLCKLLATLSGGTPELESTFEMRKVFNSFPRKAALAVFCLFAAALFFMTIRTNFQIPDTLNMKLPNAYFYMTNGNLLPALDRTDDGRMFGTPFNGTLLWIYLIRFGQHNRTIMFFNFLFWISIFFAVVRVSRQVGASRWASFSAATLLCLSQNLLYQANSDNDDLMSSVIGTIAAVFVLRWLKNRSLRDICIASMGIGIGAGAKFFPVLYAPAFVLFVAYYFQLYWRQKRKTEIRKATRQFVLGGVIAASLVLPYVVARVIHTKSFNMTSEIMNATANKPFRIEVGLHNLAVYNLQLFVSPVTDAFFPRHGEQRLGLTRELNRWTLDHLVPNVEKYWAYLPGIIIAHPVLYDNTVWFGILSWAIGGCMLLALVRRKNWFTPPFWLTIFFCAWDAYFCLRGRYIEELGRYWILPLSLAVPLVALMIDRLGETKSRRRILFVIMPVIWASTIFCGFIGIEENPIRHNLKELVASRSGEPYFSKQVKEILSQCPEVNVQATIYGYPIYLNLKEFRGSKIDYFIGRKSQMPNLIPALSVYALHEFYDSKYIAIDLKVDRGGIKSAGFSGLGIPMFIDPGDVCTCAAACPKGDSQLLIQLIPQRPFTNLSTRTFLRVLGLQPTDHFKFKAFAQIGSEMQLLGEWTRPDEFWIDLPTKADMLVVEAQEINGETYSNSIGLHLK